MRAFLERMVNVQVIRTKTFKFVGHLLGQQKHHFVTRAFGNVTVDNVTYLRSAASQMFCTRCGKKINLINRDFNELTFSELYGCSDHKPVDPKGPKEKVNVYELRPAS